MHQIRGTHSQVRFCLEGYVTIRRPEMLIAKNTTPWQHRRAILFWYWYRMVMHGVWLSVIPWFFVLLCLDMVGLPKLTIYDTLTHKIDENFTLRQECPLHYVCRHLMLAFPASSSVQEHSKTCLPRLSTQNIKIVQEPMMNSCQLCHVS